MVLVDTSVWIEHFRRHQTPLAELLKEESVLIHPFIAGELACGNLANRAGILKDLNTLPSTTLATHNEVSRLIEDRRLWGRGIGWVDVHLLASALLSKCRFWTLDNKLAQAAGEAGLAIF